MQKLDDFLKKMDFNYFGAGKHKTTPDKLFATEDALFLDVRSVEEYETISFDLKYHIPSLHIPTDEIPERLSEIPKDKFIGVFCPASVRATMIFVYLKIAGFENVKIVEGGYNALTAELKPGKIYKRING